MTATPLTNTLVTLYIDTTANLSDPTVLKNSVWFADSDGDIANNNGGNVQNYLTDVTKNGNITWVGAVLDIKSNPSHYVTIKDITPKDADGRSKLNINHEPGGPANANVTHVSARVTGNVNPLPFAYTITFVVGKINNLGERNWNTYTLDPRIRIKQ
jgi:hypothetical protein